VSVDEEGNPKDTAAPGDAPSAEPPRPPLDEPPDPSEEKAKDDARLSKQVPLGLLFFAATAVILLFLAIVGAIGYFALSPAK